MQLYLDRMGIGVYICTIKNNKRRKMNPTKKNPARYRILNAAREVKFAGTDQPSWLTLEMAKVRVDYNNGEGVFEYSQNGDLLWEVL